MAETAPAAKKERKPREAGDFEILVAAGLNDDGQKLYRVVGKGRGTSKKNAIANAVSSGDTDLEIGDQVVAVSSKQFVEKTLSLSI